MKAPVGSLREILISAFGVSLNITPFFFRELTGNFINKQLAALMSSYPTIARVAKLFALDSQVISTLFLRGWSIIAGAVMVLLLPYWLGGTAQGYYYTFASLIGLQIFFELGMNQVILQLVSHDYAHLQRAANQNLSGDRIRLERLAGLVSLLGRWYLAAAVLFFALVSICGVVFFSRGEFSFGQWLGPWLLLTVSTAVNLYLSAVLAVLEGSGEIAAVAKMRLSQSILGYLCMWGALSVGASLWAVPLIPIVAAVYTFHWIRKLEHPLLHFWRNRSPDSSSLNWSRDIFPFQWRIALSWVSGYFIFQLFTPIAFANHGAVEAGRLGITLAIFNSLLTVGMSWVSVKVPQMAAHISRSERLELNTLFVAVTRRSVIFTALAAIAGIAALAILASFAPAMAHRFASVPVASCIAVVTVLNTFIFAAASYMRAHKEGPMLWASLATGVATLLAVSAGASFGVLPMMLLYASVTLFISLPWTIFLFRRYFRKTA